LAGEILVESYLNDLACFERLPEVRILCADGAIQNSRVMHTRRMGERLLIHLEGYVSSDMARSLTGCELYVGRDELPPPPEGEFYWFDLQGLSVYTEDGVCLGRVEEFFPTGSNEVLVVRQGAQETLLPFIKDVILAVDVAQGCLRVRVLPGLLSAC
jgi:16S rRNA processing protein RimM